MTTTAKHPSLQRLYVYLIASSFLFIINEISTGSISAFADSTVAILNVAPDANSPAGPTTNLTPQFDWSVLDLAQSYEFMLTDDTDTQVYFDQAGIAAPPFAIAGAVYSQTQTYHWKVRGFGRDGLPGPWSAIESFLIYNPAIIPVPSAPSGNITTSIPLFQWTAVPGAVSYEILITNQAQTAVINDLGGLTATSYQEPTDMPLVPYTTYKFMVRARLSDGTQSMYSSPSSFMVYEASDTPLALGPSGPAPSGLTNFSWTPVGTASAGYEIQIMNATGSAILVDEQTVINGFALPSGNSGLKLGVAYSWQVRSLFSSGEASAWSKPMEFIFFDPAIVPFPLAPSGYVHSKHLLLEWSQVNGAQAYEVQILDALTSSVAVSDTVVGNTVFNVLRKMGLKPKTPYQWQVRSVMGDGSRSQWSALLPFEITSEVWANAITELKTSATYFPKQTITMSWKVLNMTSVRYHLVLREVPTPGQYLTVWSGDAHPTNPGSLTLPPDVLLGYQTRYQWIVQAYDIGGNLVGESKFVSFKTPQQSITATRAR